MRNVKLTIEYDGTGFSGWQTQQNARAVQDVVKAAINQITGETVDLTGSSRTDAGVHALGLAANFHTESSIPPERFAYALNSALPDDVVIKNSEEVDLDFHARFAAKAKKYRYLILNSMYPSAIMRYRAYHVRQTLDFGAMQEAVPYFLGEHDFSAFKASGSETKSSVRTILKASIEKKEDILEFEITGDGFLYNMVRIIAGTLVDVGLGKISPNDIQKIIESMDRRSAGRTAPAHGLYLVEVYYSLFYLKNEMKKDYTRE